MTRARVGLALGLAVALAPAAARGWEAYCEDELGAECPDAYARAQTPWRPHLPATGNEPSHSEHLNMLAWSLELSGLPASLADPFALTVFTSGETLVTPPGFGGHAYQSIHPVRIGARETRTRELSVPAMASLPDFGYSLWDWATGFEFCPPDPAQEPVECHDWKTHMGWLNSNHFPPQSRRHYEHLHALAVGRAAECKAVHDALPGPPATERERFRDWLLACEKEALAIEGVAQHFLQDSWSSGHMWERWGGPEVADWGGDRTLGLAVAMLSGILHGAKGIVDYDPLFAPFGPFDDRLSGPNVLVNFAAPTGLLQGAGDLFFDPLRENSLTGSGIDLAPQRALLLACSTDGLREVYEASAMLHGPAPASFPGVVEDDFCWDQRVTNQALAAGCGVDIGAAPFQVPVGFGTPLPEGLTSIVPLALLDFDLLAPGLPPLPVVTQERFRASASGACTLAAAVSRFLPFETFLANGRLPSIAGIEPNSAYARGGAGDPGNLPSSYADPFLPWRPAEGDPASPLKEALNLTFADAHAADRCHEQTAAGLDAFVDAATEAVADDEPPGVIDARCGQCVQRIAPHLRFGSEGSHDPAREAFCAHVNPAAPFLYTGDDPSTFADADADLASLLEAAYERCGCCAATGYLLTRLGIPPGNSDSGFATAINDAGVVVGNGESRAFRWTPQPGRPSVGSFSELSPLSGDDRASAEDINAQGDAVGSSSLPGSRQTAVIWHGGAPSVVGPTAQYSGAAAISDAGLVSGSTNGVGGWLVDGGVVTFFDGNVAAINEAGALAGSAGTFRPAFWPSTTAPPVFLAGIGVGGIAFDLNNAGLVVGTFQGPGYEQPFVSVGGGGASLLPTIPGGLYAEDGDAYGVNEKGEIVGSQGYDVNEILGERAVLWVDGEPVDLNTRIPPADAARFVLARAHDINERGQIVGWGVDLPFEPFTYHTRAFLLTPRCAAE